jgi:site-specific DNA recombinase
VRNYVIYARKSSESEDRQVLSIDSQIRELRDLAARHGVSVGEVLTESRSAKAPGRPVFGELMRRIDRGRVKGIIAWKMDRLARNHLDTGRVLQALADGRLEKVITSDGVKTSDGNDRLMGTFEFAFATKFIDDLRANVKRGNRARFEKGWPNHLPPIGYLNDRVHKTIVKDPYRFDLVRRMWDLLLEGKARPKEIARIASREWGLLTVRRKRVGGNPITYSTIYKHFRNPYYAGYIRLKDGRQYVGAHEPMITPEEFQRAQEILGSRARAGPVKHENRYAGFIRCGYCGCSVVAEFHTKAGRTYTYHRCCHNKQSMPCHEKPITEAALEEQLAGFFGRLAIPEPILNFLRDRLDRLDTTEAGMNTRVQEQRERALTGLQREEREILGLRMRGMISDEEFQREREGLSQRRQDLERALSVPADDPALHDRVAEVSRLLDLVNGGPLVIREGTPVQLRSLLEQLQLEITLRGRRLDFTVLEPLSQLVKAGSVSNWCATWPEIWKWIVYGDNAGPVVARAS